MGRVAAEADGVVLDEQHLPGRQGRLLFAYLAAEHGRPVPRDELAEVLWGDAPPATSDKALSVLVSKLRALLAQTGIDGVSALTAAYGCYRLDLPDGSSVDVLEAENAAREAERFLASDELEKANAAAMLAESLLRRPFLPGDDGTWVQGKRRELAEVRARALSTLAETCLRSGKVQESVRWAEQVIEVEPFRESGYRHLMAAHIAAGNRAEALRVYERCRRLLAEELGAYPSPETESMYRGLLEAPSGKGQAATAPATPPSRPAPRRSRSRRKVPALAAASLLVAGGIAAAVVLASRGGSAPKVVPNSVIRIDPATMNVTQVVPVGNAPDVVIASGGFLWITNCVLRDTPSGAIRNAGDRTLTRVDPATGKAVVVGGGLAPCGVTADPSGDVWVANCFRPGTGQSANVVRVDATTLAFKATWPVLGGDGSFYRGLAYGGGSLWISDHLKPSSRKPETVAQFDPRTGATRTIRVPRPPGAMAWSEGYGDLWITDFPGGNLMRLHAATGKVETLFAVETNPASAVVDGDAVWVGDWGSPEVVRLRAVGPARPSPIFLPVHARAACINYSCVWTVAVGAGAVWATTPRDRALWRIDPKTNAVTRVSLPYLPTGVTADANNVWVTLRGA